jgi:hypothetical protein
MKIKLYNIYYYEDENIDDGITAYIPYSLEGKTIKYFVIGINNKVNLFSSDNKFFSGFNRMVDSSNLSQFLNNGYKENLISFLFETEHRL